MPKFVIEREIPGAGQMTDQDLRAAALKAVAALRDIGPHIQWLHSYVTDNKVYCVYLSPDEATILQHAERAGIPANRVSDGLRKFEDPRVVARSRRWGTGLILEQSCCELRNEPNR